MAHLRKKGDKKWQIVLNIGINPKTGRQKRKTKIINCSHSKAKDIMHRLAAKYEKDIYNDNLEITLETYLKRWLKETCKNSLAPRTYNDYSGIIHNHIIPYLGKLKIKNIKPHHVIKYQNDKLNDGRLNGVGGLSKRTVQNHHRILSKALSDAIVPYQLISTNPCRNVKAPSPDDPEINPFTEEEMKKIFKAIENFHFYSIVYVDRETGLRRGEILALKWNDINLENNNIYVQRSVQEIRGKGLSYKKPKNDSSYRNIYVFDDVIKIFEKLLEHHNKIKHEDNLVFTHSDGTKIRPNYVTKKFKKTLKKIKLNNHRFHDLRHTHATELLKAGVNPKIVQERLGHNKIKTTLDTYSHVIPSMQKDAIKQLKKYQNKD